VTIQQTRPAWVRRVADGTPAGRDRAIDGLRALAICGVVAGHWLVAVQVPHADGALHNASPLRDLPYLAPASWVLQMLGLFFLVGGYTGAIGWARARERGTSYADWLGARTRRLGRPVLAVTAAWGCALPLLALAGVPGTTLRTCVVLIVQPLWFIGVYLVATALTPLVVALDRRLGVAAPLPAVAIVAVVDALRYGPWAHAVPGWVGLINIVPGWLFAYQLGVAWAHGRLRRRTAALMAAAGVALFAVLIARFGYPASMVGVPGAGRSNSNPPSLLVIALAAAQCGIVILLRDRIAAWLRHPVAWAAVVMANLAAMTVFCWHLTAVLLVSLVSDAVAGPLPGLHDTPAGPGWVLTRLAWLPVFAVVLAGLWFVVRRWESAWPPGHRVAKTLVALASAGFAVYALTVM
jgi:peptidoglycan/LPS O-acetylase OafA/YrhL